MYVAIQPIVKQTNSITKETVPLWRQRDFRTTSLHSFPFFFVRSSFFSLSLEFFSFFKNYKDNVRDFTFHSFFLSSFFSFILFFLFHFNFCSFKDYNINDRNFPFFFLSFSSQPAVTTADLTTRLLSFLFIFDVASHKSHASFFLSFFQDYDKNDTELTVCFFLSFFLSHSNQPAVTTDDFTIRLLSFLFFFDEATHKSRGSFFLSFFL